MMRSFRARLTVWNAVVIAVVLVAFSAGIVYANQARLAAGIDRDLADRALHGPPPPLGSRPGGPPGQNVPVPDLDFPQPGGNFAPPADNNGNPPMRQGGGNYIPPRFRDPIAMRFADVRMPRRFNADGSPMGPTPNQAFDQAAVIRAAQGQNTYSDGSFQDEPIRIFTARVQQGPDSGQIIQVARETSDLHRLWSAQLWTLAIFLPIAIVGAAAGAFFLTNRAIKPIAGMKQAANAISEQDLSQRLKIDGHDEFAELGETFNAMVDRLEASFTGLREAYEAQKRFTADASHELRTPLTRLRLATSSALAPDATEEDRIRALQVSDAAAASMARLVQEMLVLAKADAGQLLMRKDRLDLRAVVTDALQQFSPEHVTIAVDLDDHPASIEGDRDHLERVVTNLVENALKYTPAGGSIRISVCQDANAAELRVSDSGPGIAAEHLPHLTERFYRADVSRDREAGGVGLGLAICKTIVEAHGGTLSIQSEAGNGTTIIVSLPKAN